MPQTMRELVVELGRLNDNLEGLAPTLDRIPEFLVTADRLAEAMEDIRNIAAPWLGFRVVKKK